MIAFARVLAEFGFLCALTLVPGWFLLRTLGFVARARVDALLATLAVSTAYVSIGVTILLLAHVYTRFTVAILLLLPVLAWWRRSGPAAALEPVEKRDTESATDPTDLAVFSAAGLFLVVYLVDALTTPATWWDGLASWGKWAADWGLRTNSSNYLVGGYPQLVPRIISVLYKFSGTGAQVLPLEFFAAHAFHVWFCAWFVVAAARMMRLMDLPSWPAVLAGIGSMQFREHTGAGTVDVLVAAQVTTLLALYFGWRSKQWDARHPEAVLGGSAAATLFTKLTGGVGLVLFIAAAGWRLGGRTRSGVVVRRAVLIGLLGILPFVLEQGYTELRIRSRHFDPYEVNLSVRQTPALLAHDATVTYRGGGVASRPKLIQLRFWNSYDVPATLRVVFSAFTLALIAAAAFTPLGRWSLPVVAVYFLIWLLWSSYDQRNLFPVLGLLAALAAAGGRLLWLRGRPIFLRAGMSLLAGTFLVLAGGSILKDVQARAGSVLHGPQSFSARLGAMSGTPENRVALFFPQFQPEYSYLSVLASQTQPAHVLTTWPLFRFFPLGAHALSLWPYDQAREGDLFCSHEWHTPPADQPWVLVAAFPQHRVWVFGGVSSPRSLKQASAEGRVEWAYPIVPADFAGASYLLWEASLEARSGPVTPPLPQRASLGPAVSSSACDTPDVNGLVRCSGVVDRTDTGASLVRFGGPSGTRLLNFRVTAGRLAGPR